MSDIHALSGAYAVDAVDDIERAGFERHLAGCAACRAEVASLREASALLADAATTTPPPALRDAVLSGITRVRPLPPVTVGGPVHRRRWFPALVAAVVLALVGVGGVVWQQGRDDTSVQISVTDQVLQDPAAQRYTKELAGGATATIVRSDKVNRAVIVTENMPAPPDGKVYQLWLQTPDRHLNSAGLMPDGADTVLLEGDAGDAVGAGVSLEPSGGSEQPTKVVALIDFETA
jgi:anti-sigma-K factor RskA